MVGIRVGLRQVQVVFIGHCNLGVSEESQHADYYCLSEADAVMRHRRLLSETKPLQPLLGALQQDRPQPSSFPRDCLATTLKVETPSKVV